MTNEINTTTAPAATFGQFFSNFDREADNIASFHNAMVDFGIEFPPSASSLMEGISFGAADDAEVQSNAAVFAGLMLELGGYILAALKAIRLQRRPHNMAISPEIKFVMHNARRETLELALRRQIEEHGGFSHTDGYAVDTVALQDEIRELLNSYYGDAEAHRKAEADFPTLGSFA